jgi:CMP-N-acetylneuraminic acid synthetase
MKKIVALLPMKANSNRVKGKNFKLFCGKPLFKWTLDTLLSIPEISKVVINTDAKDILIEHGLKESKRVLIRERPDEICGDDISMNLVIADDIKNIYADTYIMTHTTNPLLTKDTIKSALDYFAVNFKNNKLDSLFSVNQLQTRFYRQDGSAINHDPSNLIPTQDLEPWYEENSNFYIFTKESFKKTGARIGEQPGVFLTKPRESIDIDTPSDWELGVIIANNLISKEK